MLRRSRSLLSILVLTGAALSGADAAELGEARVSSHVGQQLVADIELAMIEDPAAQVAVRVASPEVYRGAGIALPPVLPGLNLTVMRRDGRQFLHVTSLRPVDADHLHLYLELTDKGQRVVRLATLWLTPDPNPAPPPASAPAPAPVPVPMPVPAGVAPPLPAAVPRPAQKPVPVPVPVPVRAHTAAAPPPAEPAAKPAAPPAERKKPLLVLPIHKPVKPAALHADGQPAACTPDEAQACTALGTKNAALREQLAKLEEKVKGLQKALGVTPVPAAATHKADPHATGEHKAEDDKAAEHKPGQPKPDAHKQEAHKQEEHKQEEHKQEERKQEERKQEEPKQEEPKQEEHKPDAPAEIKPPEARPAPPPGPKPISSIKPLVPHKPKAAPPEEGGTPWAWIGAGVALLAAAGGGALAWKRRAAGGKAAAASTPETEQKVAEPTME